MSQTGFTFYEFVGALSGKTEQKDESLGDTSTHLGELIDATKFSELLGEDEMTVKTLLFFRAADKSRDGLLQFDEFADGVSSLPGFPLVYVDHKRLTRDQVVEVVDGGWNWLTRVHWRNTRCQSQCATSWEDCLKFFVDEGNTFKIDLEVDERHVKGHILLFALLLDCSQTSKEECFVSVSASIMTVSWLWCRMMLCFAVLWHLVT